MNSAPNADDAATDKKRAKKTRRLLRNAMRACMNQPSGTTASYRKRNTWVQEIEDDLPKIQVTSVG